MNIYGSGSKTILHVLNFIEEENCFYFFNQLPIDFLLKR